jgi:hypothetical protein
MNGAGRELQFLASRVGVAHDAAIVRREACRQSRRIAMNLQNCSATIARSARFFESQRRQEHKGFNVFATACRGLARRKKEILGVLCAFGSDILKSFLLQVTPGV